MRLTLGEQNKGLKQTKKKKSSLAFQSVKIKLNLQQ